MTDPVEIVQAYFGAYADKDRTAVEALLAPEFRFTSPYDQGIGRDTYFEKCWPTSEGVRRHQITDLAGDGEIWLVRYRLELLAGEVLTNMERFTIRDGLVRAVEVYFGDPSPVPRPDSGSGRKVTAPPRSGAA